MSDRTRKPVSIRNKTDHDLLILVQRELDRGLTLVDLANTRTSPLFAQVEKAYDTVRTILPRMSGLSEGDRLHMVLRLKGLRVRLDQVPAYANVRSNQASFASQEVHPVQLGSDLVASRLNGCPELG
jgi:hypothetical protein